MRLVGNLLSKLEHYFQPQHTEADIKNHYRFLFKENAFITL